VPELRRSREGCRRVKKIVLALLLLAGIAHADPETGGSVGGGDWGGDSPSAPSNDSPSYSNDSPSSYSYSSNDTSSSSSSSSSGGSHGGGGPSLPPAAILGILAIGVVFVGGVALATRLAPKPALRPVNAGALIAAGATTDVTVLQIALDARARTFVQRELARIAQAADTKTADGRATLLREVALMLRRLRDSWVYGGAINEPMMWKRDAQQVFTRHVDDARARFKTETIRNEQGVTTRADAPELHSTSDDGPGLMLVTVVVAATHELFTVAHVADGEDLRKALEALSSMIASELIAVEIVWMPSSEDERLSSIALEAAYPDGALIKLAGATAGKTFCTFCGAPYPAEAIACPNCGGRPAEKT